MACRRVPLTPKRQGPPPLGGLAPTERTPRRPMGRRARVELPSITPRPSVQGPGPLYASPRVALPSPSLLPRPLAGAIALSGAPGPGKSRMVLIRPRVAPWPTTLLTATPPRPRRVPITATRP